jgi:diguanylate cyclase (GGDEF)-like protein
MSVAMLGWALLAAVSTCWLVGTVRGRHQREQLRWAIAALRMFNERAAERVEDLQRQAFEDELTGLHNRRFLDTDLPRELERTSRFGHELTLAVLDVDGFKEVNDCYSHQVGDQVLMELGAILARSCRAVDSVVRYGGDEFVLYFPETGLAAGFAVCERIINEVRLNDWQDIAPGLRVTLSIGLAAARGGSAAELLDRADAQLYQAKLSGKNRLAATAAPASRLVRVA